MHKSLQEKENIPQIPFTAGGEKKLSKPLKDLWRMELCYNKLTQSLATILLT